MIEEDNAPHETLFSFLKQCDALEWLVLLVLLAVGILHLSLCVRSITGRGAYPSIVYALLLFSGPVLLILSICAELPPTLFLEGIDTDAGNSFALRFITISGSLSCYIFICNLLLTLIAIHRNQRGICRTAV